MRAAYCRLFKDFINEKNENILNELKKFVPDAGNPQIKAWQDSIEHLQSSLTKVIEQHGQLKDKAFVILEYYVPLESRRVDALLLVPGGVIVIEFKGKNSASQADIDQAAGYARDLRAYHKDCASLLTSCFLVPTNYNNAPYWSGDILVVGPDDFPDEILKCVNRGSSIPDPSSFLNEDSYQPLPSLIKAARELFNSGSLPRIHRAATATEPTLEYCSEIIHKTANNKRRALILVCGVPGAGKTLVGLKLAHAQYLDNLVVAGPNGEKSTSPAIFLSGNGPLVEVLQYEMRNAGGNGKAFVRGVHDYVKTYATKSKPSPREHVLIYDEAQRAFDSEQVSEKQKSLTNDLRGLSEPELFVQFAERMPDWCVVVGLIGTGQEIHIGEEAGLSQWKTAIENANDPNIWDVYIPDEPDVQSVFNGHASTTTASALKLQQTIRFHLASSLYEFVKNLLNGDQNEACRCSNILEQQGYTLRITRDLDKAKDYLHDRYSSNPEARYGMLASSRDKDLNSYGIPKGYKSPGEVGPGNYGPWYSDPAGSPNSCRLLSTVATEFGSQGLELDNCLVAWGTDLIRLDNDWSNHYASGYQKSHRIKNSKKLRINAYRVLLTRGRDGCVIYIPEISDPQKKMNDTYNYIKGCGFTEI